MRKTSLNCVYELAKSDERVVFVGSDLGPGVLDEFKNEFPDRFFMEGIAEQHAVGMAAGLAMEGFVPYVNTIATFLTRRCFEQNVLDLGLHNTNVRLIANGGGVVYAPLGPTHLAIEDIAIMRSIPNMSIIAPCDADEMKRLMMQTKDYQGPIYIRLGKGFDPIVSEESLECKIGKNILIAEGADILFVTTGITLKLAIQARENLKESNINAGIMHCHTLKPFDEASIIDSLNKCSYIITIEEHLVNGGLGSICAELIAENSFDVPVKFKRIGISDHFPHGYGSQEHMMKRNGISSDHATIAAKKLLGN